MFELEGAKAPKKLRMEDDRVREQKTHAGGGDQAGGVGREQRPTLEAEIKPAVLGEIKKIFEVYKSVELVPKREMLETMAKHGKKVVFLEAMVPIKAKTNVDGEFTKIKARFVVADKVSNGRIGDVFAPAVQLDSVRYQANLELQVNGHSIVLDVEGAYLHGETCDPLSPRGRFVFAKVPTGFGLLDEELRRFYDGAERVLKVPGNVPGRQDAGVIWGEKYSKFLADLGFTQCIVDRRVYKRSDGNGGWTIVCVYVDDNRIVSTSREMLAEFETKFSEQFPNSVAPGALAAKVDSDFAGVQYERSGEGLMAKTELTCKRLMDKLRAMLEALPSSHGLPEDARFDTPMEPEALKRMYTSQTRDELLCAEWVEKAQSIGGLAGYIVLTCKPEGYLAYVALSQYLGHGLTRIVWDALLRWARYLVDHAHLKLTYRACSAGKEWEVFIDSSFFNAQEKGSFGGFCARLPGSGVFACKCFSPRKLGLPSGAAEIGINVH